MTYVTIKVSQKTALSIKANYNCKSITNDKNPYEYFIGSFNGCEIKSYIDSKKCCTIVFSSLDESAINESRKYEKFFLTTPKIKKIEQNTNFMQSKQSKWITTDDQIGSDEVGVGDFFGPLIVCATYVKNKDIELLKELHVDDSKRISDNEIVKIASILEEKINYYTVSISAIKLSNLVNNGNNPHKVLSLAHNLAHKGLIEKYNLTDKIEIYVDAFTSFQKYKAFLKDDIIKANITFHTKGETFYPSVAAASIIARDIFLKEWNIMEKELQTKIPKGAGPSVDQCFSKLKNTGVNDDLIKKYTKSFFSNFNKQ